MIVSNPPGRLPTGTPMPLPLDGGDGWSVLPTSLLCWSLVFLSIIADLASMIRVVTYGGYIKWPAMVSSVDDWAPHLGDVEYLYAG